MPDVRTPDATVVRFPEDMSPVKTQDMDMIVRRFPAASAPPRVSWGAKDDARAANKTGSLSPEATEAARAANLDDNNSGLHVAARHDSPDRQVAHTELERQHREMEQTSRDTNAVPGLSVVEEFAEWVAARLNASEVPAVLSWL